MLHTCLEPTTGEDAHQDESLTCSGGYWCAPDGKLEVQLDGGALELAPEGVKDCDVNLGAVERPVCLIQLCSTHKTFLNIMSKQPSADMHSAH
jgi:hypothetical protein